MLHYGTVRLCKLTKLSKAGCRRESVKVKLKAAVSSPYISRTLAASLISMRKYNYSHIKSYVICKISVSCFFAFYTTFCLSRASTYSSLRKPTLMQITSLQAQLASTKSFKLCTVNTLSDFPSEAIIRNFLQDVVVNGLIAEATRTVAANLHDTVYSRASPVSLHGVSDVHTSCPATVRVAASR
jgi:hypothetical protein